MIKILFFIEKLAYKGFVGGAEKVLITLVNHMDPNKFDITVQTLYPDEYAKLLNRNIKYKYCYPKKNRIFQLICRAEEAIGLTYNLHIKDNYDIEVAYLEYGTTKIMAASTNTKAKKIAWVHCDFNIAVTDKDAFVHKTKCQYKKFDQIVCVSEQCKKSFDEIFKHSFPSVVIHNVIDTEEILSKADASLPEGIEKEKFTLCSVARFSPQKKISRLLEACRRLHGDGFDFVLWLVGDGALRPDIEQYIAEHEMQSYVTLCGFQPNPYPFMKAADLLVCSSEYEGFSTFITEGLILGKPIVTTDCSGMRELLGDSEYGVITKNDDESFYQGLEKLLASHDFENNYVEISNKALKRGRAFSIKHLTKNNERLFLSLTEE